MESQDKISVIIVDDEPYARKKIRTLLKEEDEFEVIGECKNGQEAIASIQTLQPDVVFLDIQMPEINGLEVLEALEMRQLPIIVFVTAFDQFAVNAFEKHALDYLLKPFDYERMQKTLSRVRNQIQLEQGDAVHERLNSLMAHLENRNHFPDKFMIKSTNEIYFVPQEDIDWIEAAGNYVTLHVGKKGHLMRTTMANIQKKLNPEKFIRVHRSQIVNVDRIKKLEPDHHGDYFIILNDNSELTLTRTYRENLFKHFGQGL